VAQVRVTLADVAKKAGLSTTAASMILNNRPDTRLSKEAAERVRAAAAELGYRPNMAARSLRTRSHTIGFLSDRIATTRFAGLLIRGAMHEARRQDMALLIAETESDAAADDPQGEPDSDPAAETLAIQAMMDRLPEGLLFSVARSREVTVPAQISGVPVVLLNATSATPGACCILPDEFEGGRAVASQLLDTGHRKIAILGRSRFHIPDKYSTVTVARRVEGVFTALKGGDVEPVAELDCFVWTADEGYRAVKSLIQAGTQFDALLCLNDRLAFGAYQALLEAGISIPRDVSVISFDDDPIAADLRPALTTAALPYEAMGELAVKRLLDPKSERREHLVPMPIRQRESVLNRTN